MDAKNSFPLLHSITEGAGPTVLLVHGMASALNDWDLLGPVLVQAGYRIYAVDLLGHGASAKPDLPEHYTMKAMYATFEDWIDSLDVPPPYFLVAHSMGGYVSLRFSLRHPERVRKLALIDPLYSTRQLTPLFRVMHRRPGWSIKLLKRIPLKIIDTAVQLDPIMSRDYPWYERTKIANNVKNASPNILNIPRTIPDLTHELPYVQPPVQVIWGDKDRTLEPDSFPPLIASLPNACGHRIHGAGHQPHHSRPETVNRLVLDFLAGPLA